ncbi:gremlin-1-like [Cydia fagiglandana]|uniref:gremlin-1-like n=1 Tax=Cydia amplana TaxID=1869771 RepID=UPI002FE6ABEE
MFAPNARCNMENFSKSHIWLAAAALLAACGGCTGAGVGGRRPFTPTDSILDIIDTEQVERILAARRRAEQATATSPSYVQRNELGEGTSDTMIVSMPDQEDSTELPPGVDFRKILKSSRNALVVTKKEYLKQDWCKTEPLVQKIRENGCLPATVINNFCYGQCNSFYIPKGPRRRDGSDDRPAPAFKSCSFCKPKKFTWITVTLKCPGQRSLYKRKRLQKIKQCKCLPVGVVN